MTVDEFKRRAKKRTDPNYSDTIGDGQVIPPVPLDPVEDGNDDDSDLDSDAEKTPLESPRL